MTIGYSLAVAEAIQKADSSCPGVQLGQLCLARGISVSHVAKVFRVSRQTIYHWFTGKQVPREHTAQAILAYLEELRLSRSTDE